MDEQIAIQVNSVSKEFKLPHEKVSSLKSAVINTLRRRRTFERQQVLKEVSFNIKKGEFYGIVGRNGSGKSTLLKLLAGIYSPNLGQIDVSGKLTPFIELGVGFNPELTGRDNVYLNGALLGFSQKEMEQMYPDIVAFAELDRFMDQKLKNYSSGMQVRLAFSIAIRAQSDILVLDEVLAVGDAAFQQKCYDHFEQLKREKRTVVFVSHDMGAVRRFCDKALYIKDGKIIAEGHPTDIADIYAEANINTQEAEVVHEGGAAKIDFSLEHKGREIAINVNYSAKKKEEMYVGLAIVKDGMSIAEITTDLDKPLVGKGKLTYKLNTELLNPGVYQVSGVTLFKLKNRELIALGRGRGDFVVKGEDLRRGGAVKLPDTWKYS